MVSYATKYRMVLSRSSDGLKTASVMIGLTSDAQPGRDGFLVTLRQFTVPITFDYSLETEQKVDDKMPALLIFKIIPTASKLRCFFLMKKTRLLKWSIVVNNFRVDNIRIQTMPMQCNAYVTSSLAGVGFFFGEKNLKINAAF